MHATWPAYLEWMWKSSQERSMMLMYSLLKLLHWLMLIVGHLLVTVLLNMLFYLDSGNLVLFRWRFRVAFFNLGHYFDIGRGMVYKFGLGFSTAPSTLWPTSTLLPFLDLLIIRLSQTPHSPLCPLCPVVDHRCNFSFAPKRREWPQEQVTPKLQQYCRWAGQEKFRSGASHFLIGLRVWHTPSLPPSLYLWTFWQSETMPLHSFTSWKWKVPLKQSIIVSGRRWEGRRHCHYAS